MIIPYSNTLVKGIFLMTSPSRSTSSGDSQSCAVHRRKAHVPWEHGTIFKAAPTAAGTSVLGNEYGVPTHWRLLAVIGYHSRSKALGDKLLSMAADNVHALFPHIFPVLWGQMKFSPESRSLQLVKSFIYSLHYMTSYEKARSNRNTAENAGFIVLTYVMRYYSTTGTVQPKVSSVLPH